MARPITLDYARINQLYSLGLSATEVAERLGTSKGSVLKIVKRFGNSRELKAASAIRFKAFAGQHEKVIELYKSGMSSEQIAKVVPYNAAHVRKIVSSAGISRPHKEALRICVRQTKEPSRQLTKGGYIRISHGRGERYLEHRRVMEDTIGRPLLPEEIVHHKNGIKTDNRPENLQLVSDALHHELHATHATCLKCSLPADKRFLCDKHYQEAKRNGELLSYPSMRHRARCSESPLPCS